jgi:phosphohistidine phosphatase
MKTILINRHAKSDWADEGMADFDRPLSERGERDAPEMAERLKAREINIDKIISSPAKRAITTCRHFCEVNGWDFDKVEQKREIYESGMKTVTDTAASLPEDIDTVIFFGHNPDFSQLITWYSGKQFGNLPTCGIVCIDFDTDNWTDTKEMNGKIRFFDFPKNHG